MSNNHKHMLDLVHCFQFLQFIHLYTVSFHSFLPKVTVFWLKKNAFVQIIMVSPASVWIGRADNLSKTLQNIMYNIYITSHDCYFNLKILVKYSSLSHIHSKKHTMDKLKKLLAAFHGAMEPNATTLSRRTLEALQHDPVSARRS